MKRVAKWHLGGESREMVRADGYVMVRRPGRIPYVMTARQWDDLPLAEDGQRMETEHRQALSRSEKE